MKRSNWSIPNFPLMSPWQHRAFFSRILWISIWKTPTYGHLLVDILQGIAKRIALLQVAGESVNPLIWTCLKIRHAGPQGWKSPKNRRSGSSSVLAGSVEVDVDVFGRIRRQAHTDRTHRASQSSAVLCSLVHLWILVYPKKWVQPRPPWALKYEPYQPPSPPHWERRGKKLRHSSVSRTIPSKPITPSPRCPFLASGGWAFSLCFCIKVHQNGLCSEKRLGEPKYIHCFKDFDPPDCTWPLKTQDNVMYRKLSMGAYIDDQTWCIRYMEFGFLITGLGLLPSCKRLLMVQKDGIMNMMIMDFPTNYFESLFSNIVKHDLIFTKFTS